MQAMVLNELGAALELTELADRQPGPGEIRVAVVDIARALAKGPDLMLADEPTGNFDTKPADSVFELMRQVNRESGTSFLMVTHNLDLARRCDRIIDVVDGRIDM